ncbi:acetylcholine receptor subunit beta-like [Haliotis cracherodii]|uniref:acetylcholine receptor subunit beta-like n=1 Tax=Haliotis cracherodii TaxID=6455 RepID=UPI0039EC360D
MESYRRIVFVLICVTEIYAGPLSIRKTLYNKVLGGYNSQIRPVLEDSEPTPVNLGFVLISLVDLNEVEQSITLNEMFKLVWQDASLQWDPADYDGVTKIYVEQQKAWLPDIFLTNTLTTRGNLGFDKLTVQVENTGLVLWQPSGLFTLSCKTDVTYFPFDKQICKMVVSTYGSPGKDISFIPDHLQRATDTPNGLWRIVNVTTELLELDDMDALPEIFVYLDLERRPVYYIVNVLLPIILLSIVCILVFFVPVDSGEKIGLCITVLLAFVSLTVASSILPVTSLQTPFLVICISSLTGMSGPTLVAPIIVLNVHHKWSVSLHTRENSEI